jgi:hypothetical protein
MKKLLKLFPLLFPIQDFMDQQQDLKTRKTYSKIILKKTID